MARAGSEKESPFGDWPHPSVGVCIVGRWEPGREGRLCCLGVDALGDHAALGGVSRAGQPATVSGEGLFHRNRIVNAIGITVLAIRS